VLIWAGSAMDFLRAELAAKYTEPAKQSFTDFGLQCNQWLDDFAAASQDPSTFDYAYAFAMSITHNKISKLPLLKRRAV